MDRCPICETRTVRRGWPTRWRISRVEIDKHGATEDQIYGPLAVGESVVVVPLSDAERLREAAKEAMNLLGNTHRELLARRKLRAALDREGEDG
jgi:hypothetical protein